MYLFSYVHVDFITSNKHPVYVILEFIKNTHDDYVVSNLNFVLKPNNGTNMTYRFAKM